MIPAVTPNELIAVADRLKATGIKGVLVSGGCDYSGRVPFEPFVNALKYMKRLGFKVFMHTGVVDKYRAQLLKDVGIDLVLIDAVISDKAIKEVIGLNVHPDTYIDSIKVLKELGLRVVPHMVVGIYKGLPSDEFKVIDLLADIRPDAAVVVVFTPYPGTPLENVNPPSPRYVSKVISYARRKLDDIPLSLGCMRPRTPNYVLTEITAINSGFNGIAFPSLQALNYMMRLGINFKVVNECCASIALP